MTDSPPKKRSQSPNPGDRAASPPVHPSRKGRSRSRSRSPRRQDSGRDGRDGNDRRQFRDDRDRGDRWDGRDSRDRDERLDSRGDRERDHNDRRDRDRPRKGGFKFKDKRRDDEHDDRGRDDRRSFRETGDKYRKKEDRREHDGDREERKAKEKKSEPSYNMGGGAPEFIVVHVNDRLGTKAAIPCLEDDTIGQLKLIVATKIGRPVGSIILKRQSERPFKDHITLGDYGISNGVQLDLEVDTRD